MENLELDPADSAQVQYNYLLKNEDGTIVNEWGRWRIIELCSERVEEYRFWDTRNPMPENYEKAFFTAPFQKYYSSR